MTLYGGKRFQRQILEKGRYEVQPEGMIFYQAVGDNATYASASISFGT
jgi:hypothetical protein